MRVNCRNAAGIERYIIIIILLISGVAFADDSHEDKIKQLAAVKAVQQASEGLRNYQADSLTDILKEMMLKNPGTYRKPAESRVLLDQWYEKEQRDHMKEAMERVFAEFGEGGKAFTYEWLSGYADKNQNVTASVDEIIRENRDTIFQPSFDSARELAVAEQWEQINFGTYPKPGEVEDLSKKGDASLTQIIARLEKEMSGTTDFFEENSRGLDKVIERVMEDSVFQYNGQLDALNKSTGGSHYTQEAISGGIREDINRFISGLERTQGRHIYGVFPSIDNFISSRAGQLEEEKLSEYVDSPDVTDLVDRNAIHSIITKDPAAHTHFIDSTAILHNQLIEGFKEEVISSYMQKVNKADGTVPGFEAQVRTFLTAKSGDGDVISRRLLSALAEVTPSVREEIAEQQLRDYFGEISNRQWEVPEKVIVEYYLTENRITSTEGHAPRSSITKEELPELLTMTDFQSKMPLLLDETISRLMALLNDDLLREGYRVLSKQVTIVDSLREDMKDKIRSAIASGQSQGLDSLLFSIYISDAEATWTSERTEFDPSLGSKYIGLFAYSEDLIRSLIRFDTQEVENEIIRKREEQASAQPTPRSSPPQKREMKRPPEIMQKREDGGGTCEERLNQCEIELKKAKEILKRLRKGMI